jgi:hypothetical protein
MTNRVVHNQPVFQIENLSLETITDIVGYVLPDDIVNLSSTNRFFRSITQSAVSLYDQYRKIAFHPEQAFYKRIDRFQAAAANFPANQHLPTQLTICEFLRDVVDKPQITQYVTELDVHRIGLMWESEVPFGPRVKVLYDFLRSLHRCTYPTAPSST